MGWQAYTASLVHSLAWPVAAVVAVVILREQLQALLSRPMRRMKVGPVEVEWEEEVAAAKAALEAQPVRITEAGPPPVTLTDSIGDLTDIAPMEAIQTAYERVRDVLLHMSPEPVPQSSLSVLNVTVTGYPSAAALARFVRERGRLNDVNVRAIETLTRLRAHAAHTGGVTPQQAREFVDLADLIMFSITNGTYLPPE